MGCALVTMGDKVQRQCKRRNHGQAHSALTGMDGGSVCPLATYESVKPRTPRATDTLLGVPFLPDPPVAAVAEGVLLAAAPAPAEAADGAAGEAPPVPVAVVFSTSAPCAAAKSWGNHIS
jgi:hypothetical protein